MKKIKTIRSKALTLISAIAARPSGLIATIAACMYVWHLLLIGILPSRERVSTEERKASGDNSLPEY